VTSRARGCSRAHEYPAQGVRQRKGRSERLAPDRPPGRNVGLEAGSYPALSPVRGEHTSRSAARASVGRQGAPDEKGAGPAPARPAPPVTPLEDVNAHTASTPGAARKHTPVPTKGRHTGPKRPQNAVLALSANLDAVAVVALSRQV
jgi:hypothetical protein